MEHIRQELATFYPQERDSRALAASTSAIALTFAIPPNDLTQTVPDDSGLSEESSWKEAYGFARMVVEVARDSSDIFPPLKAVMVALSVLIKNYDVGLPPTPRPSIDC
jgi:hypothetical protein